jgi:hypothetical protein
MNAIITHTKAHTQLALNTAETEIGKRCIMGVIENVCTLENGIRENLNRNGDLRQQRHMCRRAKDWSVNTDNAVTPSCSSIFAWFMLVVQHTDIGLVDR